MSVGRPKIGTAFMIRFPADLLEEVDTRAREKKISRAELIRHMVTRYLRWEESGLLSEEQSD